jgi:hypothetical protein
VYPLRGTKLVGLAYLDEAGVANAAHEPHVVVAGVIINPDNLAVEPRSEMSGEPGLAHSDPDFFPGRKINGIQIPIDTESGRFRALSKRSDDAICALANVCSVPSRDAGPRLQGDSEWKTAFLG